MACIHSRDTTSADILELVEHAWIALDYTSCKDLGFERGRDDMLFEGDEALGQ